MALDLSFGLAEMFDLVGQSASYTPAGGSAVPVTVIPDRPDELAAIGTVGVNVPARIFRARVAELAAAKRGDRIETGEETLTVKRARRDDSGDEWLLECEL